MLLGEQLNTPNELFYVRHHLPVPHIKADDYQLTIEGAVQPTYRCRVRSPPGCDLCRQAGHATSVPQGARWQRCKFQGIFVMGS